jgi:DNA-binding response OmpR family regulator
MSNSDEQLNSKGRVLIVEDDADIAATLRIGLSIKGYAVQVVSSSGEARAHLEQEPVDLLITDWVLPDGNGGEVCAVARATRRPLPVIVMSGAMNERSQTIIECRPDVFLPKPIRMEHLFLHVHDLLYSSLGT